MHTMNARELASVLAGLRMLQHAITGTVADKDGIADIRTDSGELEPLSADEIDTLCERLNSGSLLPLTAAYVGIGAVQGLDTMPRAIHDKLIEHHGGELHLVQAAIGAAADHGIDGHECTGVHAYEVAQEFGSDFIDSEVARLELSDERS